MASSLSGGACILGEGLFSRWNSFAAARVVIEIFELALIPSHGCRLRPKTSPSATPQGDHEVL